MFFLESFLTIFPHNNVEFLHKDVASTSILLYIFIIHSLFVFHSNKTCKINCLTRAEPEGTRLQSEVPLLIMTNAKNIRPNFLRRTFSTSMYYYMAIIVAACLYEC